MNSPKPIYTSFFKRINCASLYCLRHTQQKRHCQVIPTGSGYRVNIFREAP